MMKIGRLLPLLTITLLLFITTAGGALAANGDPSAFDHLQTIGTSFSFLFDGDMGMFLSTLLEGAPLVGVFLIVYILGRFITGTTIFKKAEKNIYENMFGVGLGLVAVATPNVYGFIVSFVGGTFVLIILLILIVTMIIITVMRGRSSAAEESAEKSENVAESRKQKKGSLAQKHDLGIQKKLQRKEDNSINNAGLRVKYDMKMNKGLKQTLKKLLAVLKEVQGIRDEGHAASYRERLMKMSAKVTAGINRMKSTDSRLKQIFQKIDHYNKKDFQTEKHEWHDEEKFKEHLRKEMKEKGHDDTKIEEHLKEKDDKIKHIINKVKSLTQKKEEIDKHELKDDEQLRRFNENLQELQKQLISQLEQKDDEGATQTASEMFNLVNKQEYYENSIKNLYDKLRELETQEKNLKNEYSHLIRETLGEEKKEEKEEKHEEGT